MALTVGTRRGPYEILAPLGAGGMGEVYRAHDAKLKHDVALKVLPEAFAQDPDPMLLFQREAEVLASLNHPNIADIYGVEERALAIELVEGETLHCPLPMVAVARVKEPRASEPADSLLLLRVHPVPLAVCANVFENFSRLQVQLSHEMCRDACSISDHR